LQGSYTIFDHFIKPVKERRAKNLMLETSEAGVFGTMVRTNIPFDCNDVNYKKKKESKILE